MKASYFLNVKQIVRNIIYLVVLITISSGYGGSFDDFFSAVRTDDTEAIRALLRRGFDVNTVDATGEPGLLLAVRQSSIKVATLLVDWPQTKIEVRSRQDESPLMLASLKGLAQLCDALIARGADVNKPGWTPLHYAATNGHLPVLHLLLENHAYIDAASPNGTTPLMMAARYGSAASVSLLLEAGADPLLKNDQGLSAIDFAHRAERKDSAELIAGSIRARHPKGVW